MTTELTVPVQDDNCLHLREMWAEAEDDKTGNVYDLTRTNSMILLSVKRPDGTTRTQSMYIKDLLIQWAVALDTEEVKA